MWSHARPEVQSGSVSKLVAWARHVVRHHSDPPRRADPRRSQQWRSSAHWCGRGLLPMSPLGGIPEQIGTASRNGRLHS